MTRTRTASITGPILHLLQFVVASVAFAHIPVFAAVEDTKSLGTLFYSPAERLAIEQSRSGETVPVANGNKSVSLKGLVRRRIGKGTSWINGQTIPEGQAVPAAGIPRISSKQVTIDGKSLRVGETLDVENGARSDFVPKGAISIKTNK